ncbi:TlpA family protein disulfide reductase [Kribbella sp. DT2]|uniref:TlpA family protein disulfide reductase n=1 Tax=Kribbella sp. DT2 TaxID=3393427 RepID=UPI003CF25945
MMTQPTRFRLVVAVSAFVVIAGILLMGWRTGLSNSIDAVVRGDDPSAEKVVTGLKTYPIADRPSAPRLSGTTLDGDQLTLSALTGHVVVINVWGSWCTPCRAEAPDLARVARETADRGVHFVGIDTRDNPASARAFARTFKVGYPSLVDSDGQLMLGFSGLIPMRAVPSTVVVDPTGHIASLVVGKVTYATLNGMVDDLLAAATPPSSSGPRSG